MRKASLRSASLKSSGKVHNEEDNTNYCSLSKLGSSSVKPPALLPSRSNSRNNPPVRTRSTRRTDNTEASDSAVSKLKPPVNYNIDHLDKRRESLNQLSQAINSSITENREIPQIKDRVTSKNRTINNNKLSNTSYLDASIQTEAQKKKKLDIAETNKEKQILLKKKQTVLENENPIKEKIIKDQRPKEESESSQDKFYLFPDDNSRTEHPSFTLLDTELANKIGECLHDSNISLYEEANCDATSISEQIGQLPPSSVCSMNLDDAAKPDEAVEITMENTNFKLGDSEDVAAKKMTHANKHVEVSAPADCDPIGQETHVVTVFQDEDNDQPPSLLTPDRKKLDSASSIILTEGDSPEATAIEESFSQPKEVFVPEPLKCSVEVEPIVKITDSAQVSISEGKSLSSKVHKPSRNVPIKSGTLKQPQMSSRSSAAITPANSSATPITTTGAVNRMPAPVRNTPVVTRTKSRLLPEPKSAATRNNGSTPQKNPHTPTAPVRSRNMPPPSTRPNTAVTPNEERPSRRSSIVSSSANVQRKVSVPTLKSSKPVKSKPVDTAQIEQKRQKLTGQSNEIIDRNSNIQELEDTLASQKVKLESLQQFYHRSLQGFDAMSIICQRLDQKCGECEGMVGNALQDKMWAVCKKEEVDKELVSCKEERDRLIRQLDTQSELNQLEVTSIMQRHAEEIKETKQNLEKEIGEKLSQTINQHSEEVKTLRAFQEKQLREEKLNQDQRLKDLNVYYEEMLLKRSKEHEAKLSELQQHHDSEMNAMSVRFESMKNSLSDKVTYLQSQCQNLELHTKSHEEYVQMMSDKQLQIFPEYALAPYEKLPEEINSLKHVLEMKTMEIVNLKATNESLREKLQGSEEKQGELLQLQYKLENMEAIITLKTDAEKQLQDRYQLIFRRLDQEARDKRKLASERDTLKFRLEEAEFYKSIREEKDHEKDSFGSRPNLNNNNVSSGSLSDLRMTSSVQMRPSSAAANPRPMSTSSISQVARPARRNRAIQYDRSKRLTLSSVRDLQQNP